MSSYQKVINAQKPQAFEYTRQLNGQNPPKNQHAQIIGKFRELLRKVSAKLSKSCCKQIFDMARCGCQYRSGVMAKKEVIVNTLDAAAEKDESRSLVGRINEIFDEITQKQAIGMSNAKIIEALNQVGFELDEKSFKAVLFRVRKKRGLTKTISRKGAKKPGKASPNPNPSPTEKKIDSPAVEEAAEVSGQLSSKQKREKHADKYASTNPLLRTVTKKETN
jgi:hypothetical protein